MKKKLLQLFLLFFLLSTAVFAQDRVINGVVRDAQSGETLPGVVIKSSQSARTAASNSEGQFTISVTPADKLLIFSFVGYQTFEKPVNSTFKDTRLTPTNINLQDVLVVGYGTQSRKEFTGSASRITAEAVKDIPVQSFEQGLIGKASGVNVSNPSGVLNDPPVIRIRGVNSISLSSSPLVVVDGIPVNTGDVSSSNSVANNPLSDINPADIESVDVLKDAASTSIYGSRAAGGVILITTKKGKAGQAKVSYDAWAGITQVVRLPELLNSDQYIAIKNEAVLNSKVLSGNQNNNSIASALFFPAQNADGSNVDTRWYDQVYRNAVSHNHNISIAGGNERTKYYFSSNYSNQ